MLFCKFLEELAKQFLIFKEPKFLVVNSQRPAIAPYSEPDEFSAHSHQFLTTHVFCIV
jgi:hypothetical protein